VATLWLVATPIGNLGDLSPRAIEVLGAAEAVCCEDTRRTGRLLQYAGIRAERLIVCNEHTEYERIPTVLEELARGDVALVSDAGSPGISDPGERLVAAALEAGHQVSAVPGPSAATMALTISGLPTGRHVFEGFIPRKGSERAKRIAEIAAEHRTVILYEAPPRVEKTLRDLRDACGPARRVVVTRELTKLHEESIRGTLGTIEISEARGEQVIVLDGAPHTKIDWSDDDVRTALRSALDGGATTRDAVAAVTKSSGRPKREVYTLATVLNT